MSRRRRRTLKSLRERIEHISRKNINGDTDFLVIFLFHSSCGREKHGLAKVQNIAENSFYTTSCWCKLNTCFRLIQRKLISVEKLTVKPATRSSKKF